MIKRRWLMMLLIFLITLMPAMMFSVNKPVRYHARGEILLIQNARVNIELSGNLSERASRNIIPLEKLNSMVEVLTSNKMIRRMIDALEPNIKKAEKEKLFRLFKREIKARVIPASNVIEVTYADADPIRAQKVVNTLIVIFRDAYRRLAEGMGAMEFYQEHFEQVNRRLKVNIGKLNELRRKEGIMDDFNLVQDNAYRRLEELKEEHVGLGKKISETQTRIALLEKELSAQPEYLKGNFELVVNPTLVEMKQKLTALELEKASLLIRYTEESREVQDKAAEIDSIKAKIARLKPMMEGKAVMVLNPVHENIKADIIEARTELVTLQNKRNKANEQIREQKAQIYHLNQLVHKFVSLENAVESDKKKYNHYLGKLDDARFLNAMNQNQISSLQVIETAEAALPNRMPLLYSTLASVILSLLLAVGTLFMMETFRPRLNNPEQVKNLVKFPVLGSISKKAA